MSILIKNGTVFDGSGKPGVEQDVLVAGEGIKAMGKDLGRADIVIDAKSKFVAPGFVDINADSDHSFTLFRYPSQESFLLQGITTIIGGNCGTSLAPLIRGETILAIQKWVPDTGVLNVNWQTFTEFLREVERARLGVNFGSFTGHTTLRRGLIGDEFRPLKEGELAALTSLLADSLVEGSFGLSTGLAYAHAKVAPYEELLTFARELKRFPDTLYATHIRDETGTGFLDAVREALEIGKEAGVPVELSHFKAQGEASRDFVKALSLIDEATRGRGVRAHFDVYPYHETASVLYSLLPDFLAIGGKRVLLANLRDPDVREETVHEMRPRRALLEHAIVLESGPAKEFVGSTLEEISQRQGVSVEEATLNLLLAAQGRVIVLTPTLPEANVRAALKHPASTLGTNGSGYSIRGIEEEKILVHPRTFGATARFLGYYVREAHLLSWEEAIQKLTGTPAAILGLPERGRVSPGAFADLVIFDPERIKDRAEPQNPAVPPDGIEYVLVNGEIAVNPSGYAGVRVGRVLRRTQGLVRSKQ